MNNYMSSRMVVGAAIVGLVGAAGVFIYEQIYAEKRRAMLVQEVARLDRQVSSMRAELEALRDLQKEAQLQRLKQKKPRRVRAKKDVPSGDVVDATEQSYASDSEYFTDYQSVLGTDGEMDSEEFYDVHTDDEDTLKGSTTNMNGRDDFDEDISDKSSTPLSTPRTT